MRWYKSDVEIGAYRRVRRFMWLPTCLGGEVRWLEFADVVQQKCNFAQVVESDIVIPIPGWKNVRWGE